MEAILHTSCTGTRLKRRREGGDVCPQQGMALLVQDLRSLNGNNHLMKLIRETGAASPMTGLFAHSLAAKRTGPTWEQQPFGALQLDYFAQISRILGHMTPQTIPCNSFFELLPGITLRK